MNDHDKGQKGDTMTLLHRFYSTNGDPILIYLHFDGRLRITTSFEKTSVGPGYLVIAMTK